MERIYLKRSGFIGPGPPGVKNHSGPEPEWFYKEVSVNRNTATETQTLKQAQGVRKPDRKPKETNPKPQKPPVKNGESRNNGARELNT